MTAIPPTAVVGAGLLGNAFISCYAKGQVPRVVVRRTAAAGDLSLDLARPDLRVVDAIASQGVRDVLLLAAVTRIDECADDPAGSRAVNVDGTLAVARMCISAGMRVIFFSTDYVYDGAGPHRDDDARAPRTEYGRQKAFVEDELVSASQRSIVVRLSKIVSPGHPRCFVTQMADAFRRGEHVSAAVDQRFCATAIDDVTQVVTALQRGSGGGVYNVCNPRAYTRHELALAVSAHVQAAPHLVTAIHLADLFGETRPRDTTMVPSRALAGVVSWTPIDQCIARLRPEL
jgi:dTDP-4-dehydrorhamnose reductase